MRISVRNFRRVERADIEGAGPIILLAGRNNQGKSSLLMGTALALTGFAVPEDRKKADAPGLVRRGADAGRITVEGDQGRVTLSYPKASRESENIPPQASPIAAGMVSICDLPRDRVAQTLAPFIRAEPTRGELDAELADAGVPDKARAEIWGVVEARGWDEAHDAAKTQGIKLKGQWEGVTRERWGAKKAELWRPDGFTDDMEVISPDEIGIKLSHARDELEAMIANNAVDGARLAQLEEAHELGRTAEAEMVGLEALADETRKAVTEAEEGLNALPPPVDGRPACPHCKKHLNVVVEGGEVKIEKADEPEKITAAESKRRARALDEAAGKLSEARAAAREWEEAMSAASAAVAAGKDAADQIEAARKIGGADRIEAMRASIADLERAANCASVHVQSQRLRRGIDINEKVRTILSADGLRRTVLVRAIDGFNEQHLKPLCEAAKVGAGDTGWPTVRIDPDLSVSFGGESYIDLGQSARWIVRAIVAVAIARLDKSAIVLLDAADVLDQANRNRLFTMLVKVGMPAIVAMTITRRDLVPDLARKNAGASFWIENGRAERLGVDQAEAA